LGKFNKALQTTLENMNWLLCL